MRSLRLVVVGCTELGVAIGQLIAKHFSDIDIQYVDVDCSKEPKPRMKMGKSYGWCKYSEGDIYLIFDSCKVHLWIPDGKLVVVFIENFIRKKQ